MLDIWNATRPDEFFDPHHHRRAAEAALSASAFRFTPVDELEFTEPEFLVSGLVEKGALALLFGDPGCGKSFIAADLALSVAAGVPFHGRDTNPGAVFFIAGEGHSGLARRFHAWSKAREVPLSGLPLFKSNRAAAFLDKESAQEVTSAAEALAASHGEPQLIVIDTVARNFGAGDENSTQDMGAFVAAMDDLKARWPGCVVMLVHHSGHADKSRARGAMALKGALDAEFRAAKEDETITLSCTKMKDAAPPPDTHFRLDTVVLSDRAESAVLVETEGQSKEKRLTPAQRLALQTFTEAARQAGQFSDTGHFQGVHRDDWRPIFYARHTADNDEAKRKAFERARSALVEADRLKVSEDVYTTTDFALLATIQIGGGDADTADMSGTFPDLS